MVENALSIEPTRHPFRLLDLAFDVRYRIFKFVLEHEHRGFDVVGMKGAPWIKLMSLPSREKDEPDDQIFLLQHDWTYAGLLLCSHQVASEVAIAMSSLERTENPGKRRRLGIHRTTSSSLRQHPEYFLTWEGPSWISCHSADLEVKFSGDKSFWDWDFGYDSVATLEIHILGDSSAHMLNAYLDFGPRFRPCFRQGPQSSNGNVLEVLELNLGNMSKAGDTIIDEIRYSMQDPHYCFSKVKDALRTITPIFPETYDRIGLLRLTFYVKSLMGSFEVHQAGSSDPEPQLLQNANFSVTTVDEATAEADAEQEEDGLYEWRNLIP